MSPLEDTTPVRDLDNEHNWSRLIKWPHDSDLGPPQRKIGSVTPRGVSVRRSPAGASVNGHSCCFGCSKRRCAPGSCGDNSLARH